MAAIYGAIALGLLLWGAWLNNSAISAFHQIYAGLFFLMGVIALCASGVIRTITQLEETIKKGSITNPQENNDEKESIPEETVKLTRAEQEAIYRENSFKKKKQE